MSMTPQQLKNSILQRAIEGKLVEQRPEEGTGEELYQKIQKEKQKLIKSGKLKKEKPLPLISEKEISFDIPENWKYVRLGTIINLLSGCDLESSQYNDKGNGIPYITGASNFTSERININRWTTSPTRIAHKGELLLTCKGTIGTMGVLTESKAHIARQVMSLFPFLIECKFLKYWMYTYITVLKNNAKSMIPGIERNSILNAPFPLPPLPEQKRIVANIEELLPYVDEYEKAWNKLEELNKRFPDNIKKSILQEAIQGKLVEQQPEEGTGEELYQKIQKEKQKLIKSGKLKKEKPLREITEDEIPFDIPESWKWVRLGQIGTWGSGATPAKGNRDYYNGRIPWLLTGDLNDGIIREMSGRITDKALSDTSVHMNPKGSVLMAMYGATIGKLGILGIAATTNQACCACDPFSGVDNKFLFYYLMARRKYYIDLGAGSGQPNISKAKIVISLFALPPLAEQKRIVTKIDELLSLCERMR